MQFGSLSNLIAADSRSHSPEVGIGATMLSWTDRHAATVVSVSGDGQEVGVQRDIARRVDGGGPTDGGQRYEYTRDPDARIDTYTLRRNGNWVRKGEPMRNGAVLMIGARDEFYDFTF